MIIGKDNTVTTNGTLVSGNATITNGPNLSSSATTNAFSDTGVQGSLSITGAATNDVMSSTGLTVKGNFSIANDVTSSSKTSL